MPRRRILPLAIVAVALALAAGALVAQRRGSGPVLSATVIGAPLAPLLPDGTGGMLLLAVDPHASSAVGLPPFDPRLSPDAVPPIRPSGDCAISGGVRPAGPPYRLQAVDARTGRLARATDLGATWIAAPAPGGRLLALDPLLCLVRSVDPAAGVTATRPFHAGIDFARMALGDPVSGHVFVAGIHYSALTDNEVPEVALLDGRSGRPRATAQPALAPQSGGHALGVEPLSLAVAPTRHQLFMFDADGVESIFDTRSLRPLASLRLPLAIEHPLVDERTGRLFGLGRPTALSGSWMPGSWTQGQPDPPGTLAMIDLRTGQLLGAAVRERLLDRAGELALGADGRVYVASVATRGILVLDGRGGAIRQIILVGASPAHLAIDAPRQRLYAAFGDDRQIAVLDMRRGTRVRTIDAGATVLDLAVDPVSGHLAAVTASLDTSPSDRWAWLPGWLRRWFPASQSETPPGRVRYMLRLLDPATSG